MTPDDITWQLVTCPDHQDQGAVHTGSRLHILALRAGCTRCHIVINCPCGYTSHHALIALAHRTEQLHLATHHQDTP